MYIACIQQSDMHDNNISIKPKKLFYVYAKQEGKEERDIGHIEEKNNT